MTCSKCDKDHNLIDHFMETTPLDIVIEETHNPLDIPFGHEVKEVNNNVKSNNAGGPEDVNEGGQGSGRNPEGPGDTGGSTPGPLVTFETTVIKEMLDAKLNCPCNKNK